MRRIEFAIDRDLRVIACTEHGRDGHVRSSADCLGRLYHEIVPAILLNDRDAVAQALLDGQSVQFPSHRHRCIYDSFAAPVSIRPRFGESGEILGVQVTIDFPFGCRFVNSLSSSKSLIEIGKSASMLAHGVRNPLNAIKGAIVFLKERYSHEDVFIEFADLIDEEIASLDRFITNFLSSSFDSCDYAEVDLNDLLRKAETVVGLQAASSGVMFDFVLEGVLPVRGNPFLIKQTVMNILTNALQAMQNGGRISVRSAKEENGQGAFARVVVADDGPGFPEGFVKEVSTPVAEGSGKGRGFGLFIAREVLQSHGGSLEIRNEDGRGTKVTILLPVCSEQPLLRYGL